MNRLLARMLGRLYREEGEDDGGNGSPSDDVKFAYHDRAAWLEQIAGTTEDDQTFGTGTHDDDEGNGGSSAEETEEEKAARLEAEAAAAALAEEEAAVAAGDGSGSGTGNAGDEQMVELIVDGKTVKRKLSEVLDAGKRFMQKDMTADERLVEATRILKEAKQVKGIAEPSSDARTTTVLPTDEDADAELARAIQLGSDEEARDAIKKLRQSGKSDDASITSMIDARLEFREAAQWVQSKDGYADILSDSLLGGVFMQKEQEARQSGDKRPYRELYKEIGDDLRKWRDGLAPKPDALQNKQDRKAKNVVNIPTARAVASVNAADDEDATDAAETQAYLAEQRRRRGQG